MSIDMSESQPNPVPGYAEIFKRMAERIERNKEAFGGAFLMIGPDGKVVETLVISDEPNMAQFWGLAKIRIEVAQSEVAMSERNGAFGGRR
jgi:hypothetical protein